MTQQRYQPNVGGAAGMGVFVLVVIVVFAVCGDVLHRSQEDQKPMPTATTTP